MITIGQLNHWKGDRIDIQASCKDMKDALYLLEVWKHTPPPILDFIHNGKLPKKKWDFHAWEAKYLKSLR